MKTETQENPEATVVRLLEKRAEEEGKRYPLQEVERLRIDNISLRRELLSFQLDATEGEYKAEIEKIRARLLIPKEFTIGISKNLSEIVVIPPEAPPKAEPEKKEIKS